MLQKGWRIWLGLLMGSTKGPKHQKNIFSLAPPWCLHLDVVLVRSLSCDVLAGVPQMDDQAQPSRGYKEGLQATSILFQHLSILMPAPPPLALRSRDPPQKLTSTQGCDPAHDCERKIQLRTSLVHEKLW